MMTILQRDISAEKVELLIRVVCTHEHAEKLKIEAICSASAKNIANVNQEAFEEQTI